MTSIPATQSSVDDIRESIQQMARAVLERAAIDPAVDLFDQGATSLAFLTIVAQVNDRFSISLDVSELEEATIDMITALVHQQVSAGNSDEARSN
ncbi:MAG TPA: acyl carrier protein [Pseudonocardiaceae bacterium]|jgi:acyl carrier protein